MPVISGKDGTVTFASGYVKQAQGWTVDVGIEDVMTTKLGATWKTRTFGVKEWSGTYSVQILDNSSFGSTGTTSDDFIAVGGGIVPAVAIFTLASTDTLTGLIMITGVTINTAVDGGAATAEFTFVGSGPVVIKST